MGHDVLKELLIPASAPVLSEPVGRRKQYFCVGIKARQVCMRAICASVSKQLM